MSQHVASMTGYARTTSATDGHNVQCELKSVNARGLDIRIRLAPGLDALEPAIRRMIAEHFSRGSISCAITVQHELGSGQMVINQQALGAVLGALDDLSQIIDADPPRLDGILGIKGVLEFREITLSGALEEQVHLAILECIKSAIEDLARGRKEEGSQLARTILLRIDEIEVLTERARAHPSRKREFMIERLRRQIADLGETGAELSEDRLHVEALVLATKADIREEMDRLFAHVKAARQLLQSEGPIGRKLDFLAQEFNREANTLCAKSHTVELTSIGLDLKAAIDQLREQVQNIE